MRFQARLPIFLVTLVILAGVSNGQRRGWIWNTGRNRGIRLQLPKIEIPEITIPDIQIPEIPEIQIPEIPEIQIPEIPEIQIPEIPEVQIPEIKMPEIPAVQVPDEISPSFSRINITASWERGGDWIRDWFGTGLSSRDRSRPKQQRSGVQEERHTGLERPPQTSSNLWEDIFGTAKRFRGNTESSPRDHPPGRGVGRGRYGSVERGNPWASPGVSMHIWGSGRGRGVWRGGDGNGRRGYFGTSSWTWPDWRPQSPFSGPGKHYMDAFRNNFFQHHPAFYHHPPHHHLPGLQRPGSGFDGPGRDSDLLVSGPSYETVCEGHQYSARRYNSSVWVTTDVVNGSSMEALQRIKAYFLGHNDQGLVLEMSRPLRMTVWSLNGTISDTDVTTEDFILSAMVPTEFEGNPPAPLDSLLNITVEHAHVVYAAHFRRARRPGTAAIYDEFFNLQSALESGREMFERGLFHTAFYETWNDILSGFLTSQPRPGEILIPGGSGNSDPVCVAERPGERGYQNGIKQCGNSRCPEYERLEQLRNDVELRRIRGASYITRTAPGCVISLSAITSHFALQRYLSGANDESRKYPAPVPFVHYVYPSRFAACFCKQTMTSAYMLPDDQPHARPTQGDLKIHTQPDRDVYVIKFGGRPTTRRVERKVDELRRYLRRTGRCFIKDKYLFAIYDHPFNRPPHLNEVMVFRKDTCRWGEDSWFGVEEDTWEGDFPVGEPLNETTTEALTTTSNPSTVQQVDSSRTETVGRGVTQSPTTRTAKSGTTPPSDREPTTTLPPLLEIPLYLESNSIMDVDLVPYRFSGNETNIPEDFPTDVFVY